MGGATPFHDARPRLAPTSVVVLDGGTPVASTPVNSTGDHQPLPNALVNLATAFSPGAGSAIRSGVDLALTVHFTADQDLTSYTAGVERAPSGMRAVSAIPAMGRWRGSWAVGGAVRPVRR